MSQHTELIAKLIALSEMLDEYEAGGFKWSEEAATARDAADALQALERVWQPIETAPKDGQELLVHTEELGMLVMYWDDYHHAPRWCTGLDSEEMTATHWMPLPTPPESKG